MKIAVRPAEPRDQRRWRELFNGYCLFYERKPDEALNTHTWRRILDPAVPVHAIVAEADGAVIGIANYLIHEHTLGLTPACYLGDLFVDPEARAAGVGRALIDWRAAGMKRHGWRRRQWLTAPNKHPA